MYRISITLVDSVRPDLLQLALDKTLPRFSAFRVRLKHGLFWNYLEANPALAQVQEEDDYPCRYIDPLQNNGFLFRVSYFDCRINLEVFHVLTDGTGALQFLKALVCQYLLLAHPAAFTTAETERFWFSEHADNTEDSYVAHYTPTPKARFRMGKGFHLKGERRLLDALSVIHAHIPMEQLLELCHTKEVTITQYLTACIGWALYTQQMHGHTPKRPANILLPVNLRNMFESTTTLNFFTTIYISLRFTIPNATFDDVLAEVKSEFEKKLSREAMQQVISYTVGSGYSPFIRMVPLPLKSAALRLIYESSAASNTMGFSNLGKVELPPAFAQLVAGASVLLSAPPRDPFKCTACSFGNMLTFSMTSLLRSTALQRAIVRQMAADGLDVTLQSNGVDYEEL